MENGLAVEKSRLRKSILLQRNQQSLFDQERLSEQISSLVAGFEAVKNRSTFFIYLNFGSEVITSTIINNLFNCSKTVAVPRTSIEKKSMNAVVVKEDFKTITGCYGIKEPSLHYNEILEPEMIDCIVLPGAVFDRKGGRIGYGGGYYDKYLSLCRDDVVTIGAAFSLQLYDSIPQEKHDVKMQYIVTENEIIDCNML